MEQDQANIYQKIPNVMHTCVVCFSEHYIKPKTATDSSAPKVGISSTEPQCSWYHSVDKKHSFRHIAFKKAEWSSGDDFKYVLLGE
ncbi:hypothetical protein [Absidia glauca]|uniref:Uncharacterized protein n=1 Tax=Absidia glauca TaxID=4829 RepID=A0A168N820_ABSGL|nr:hypothetical protein [Absidia glauca]